MQRGFVIDEKSDKLICDISEKYRTSKSIVLDVLFHPGNRSVLCKLFEDGVRELAIPVDVYRCREELK